MLVQAAVVVIERDITITDQAVTIINQGISEVQVATTKNVAITEVQANITLAAQVNVILDIIHIMVAITIKRKDTLVQADSFLKQ